jgi:3-methyl-2-oxobutanoate hydroxymethyltransferase
MAKKKMTIPDFRKYKEEGRKFAYTTAYDYTMATIVNESDVEIILVGDSLAMCMLGRSTTVGVTMEDMIHHIKPVVLGAPETFVVGDMPFGSYNQSPEQAIANASRMLMETNCDAIKLEGANMAPTIRRLVEAGIPVMGHIGLTPQTASSVGGFKVQGGTPESAAALLKAAKEIEAAGAFSLVVECVPKVVGKALRDALEIPVLGIGAGPDVDCQVLVSYDLLGMYNGFKPKFVKHFANIRQLMVDGLNQFHQESVDGTFPNEETSFNKAVDIPKLY